MKNQGIIIKNTKKVKLTNTSIKGNKIELSSTENTQEQTINNQGYLIEEVASLAISETSTENNQITETKKRKRKTSQEELHQDEEVIAMEIDEQFSSKSSSSSQIQQTQTENNYLHSQLNKVEELTEQTQVKKEVSQQALNTYRDNLKNKSVKGKETEQETQIVYNLPKST